MTSTGSWIWCGRSSVTELTGREATRLRPGWVALAVVPFLAALALAGRASLNGDVMYALGGMRAAGRGGVGVGDVFVARPYAYRLLLDGLDKVRALVTSDATSGLAEWTIRISMDVLVAGVGVLLYLGLRRYVARTTAALVAVVVTGSLIVAPPWHFLEPDWVGACIGVLVVGCTLWPRRAWLAVVLGSVAVWLTIAMKTATVTWALLGLLAVALLTWRRALGALVGGLALTVVWVAWMKLTHSWEWIWLQDQAKLVDSSPLHRGVRVADLAELAKSLVNVAVVSPIVVAAPVAAVLLVVRRRGARARWAAAGVLLVAAGLSVASAYGQGEWFMYHFAGTPVTAAAVWALALARPSRARIALLVTPVVASVVSLWAMAQPLVWRKDHLILIAVVLTVIAAGGIVAAVLLDRGPVEQSSRGTSGAWAVVAGLVAAVSLVVAGSPRATYSFDAYDANIGVSYVHPDAYARMRAQIGPDTRVTYFAYGSLIYQLGNPTTCRYPSPQWLQRAGWWPRVRTFASYVDNARCLADDGGAKYLVWQPAWFSINRSAPAVQEYAARFDCSADGRVKGAPRGVVICPRKA